MTDRSAPPAPAAGPPAAERLSTAFELRRRVAAPPTLVFDTFTQARHLRHWFGPKGFTMSHCEVDLRPGGVFHYCLTAIAAPGAADERADDAKDLPSMWGLWQFREIEPPGRLVVVSGFSRPEGGFVASPFPGPWPLRTLSTTLFDSDGAGGTLVTVRWQAVDATPDEEQAFAGAFESMQQGWAGTFEQLDDYLALVGPA
jgi:uncharacterized protein YndB with AHSA1/START domain